MKQTGEDVRYIVQQHDIWYPLMELRDYYKLLYQGVMGSEHIIETSEGFSDWLRQELASVEPIPGERLLEPIRRDHALFRLNLRPYKARGVDLAQLVPALISSSHEITGTKAELRQAWGIFSGWCAEGIPARFEAGDLEAFNHRLDELDYPAMHHSEMYSRAYHPAYRLLSANRAIELGLKDTDRL